VSDPAHPVPYRHRPIDMTYPTIIRAVVHVAGARISGLWTIGPDVLSWETGGTEENVTLAGTVTANCSLDHGQRQRLDRELIDVYPEKVEEKWQLSGYELMIADEVFRGRFSQFVRKAGADYARGGDAVYD